MKSKREWQEKNKGKERKDDIIAAWTYAITKRLYLNEIGNMSSEILRSVNILFKTRVLNLTQCD